MKLLRGLESPWWFCGEILLKANTSAIHSHQNDDKLPLDRNSSWPDLCVLQCGSDRYVVHDTRGSHSETSSNSFPNVSGISANEQVGVGRSPVSWQLRRKANVCPYLLCLFDSIPRSPTSKPPLRDIPEHPDGAPWLQLFLSCWKEALKDIDQ